MAIHTVKSGVEYTADLDGHASTDVKKWLLTAFLLRLALMLFIHFSGVDRSMSLTKDAFFYDEVGQQIAEYYQAGGIANWPARVTGYIDCGWEYFIGIVYYLVGYSPLTIKFFCVLAGTVTPYLHYRTAWLVTSDNRIATGVLALSVLFPTQVYYSALMVRDSMSALAVALIFWGLAEFLRRTGPKWVAPFGIGLGFVMMIGLRSYLATVLAVMIPVSFLITALVTRSGQRRAVLGMLLIGLAAVGVVTLAPNLIGELDTQFTDIDYVNKVRTKMNVGAGAMFSPGSVTKVGSNIFDTIFSFAVGLYFFFFSINPTDIGSIRQIMAMPEVLLVAFGAFYALFGVRVLLRERRQYILPILIPTLFVTLGYSAATTNGGPLMRWRMQLIGVYLILGVTGWVTRKRWRDQRNR